MSSDFQITGTNTAALFTLKIHRGDGMALVAMNWKKAQPPIDFVGFAIEYKEPGGIKFFALKNRLNFPKTGGAVDPNTLSTLRAPIQLLSRNLTTFTLGPRPASTRRFAMTPSSRNRM